MLRETSRIWPVITAEQLRDARIRAGYSSQRALAEALDVSERSVTSWEAEGGHVSTRSEARVRALLWPAPGPLSSYSSYELLSELGRRLDAASQVVREPDDPEIRSEDNDTPNDVRRIGAEGTSREQFGESPASAGAGGDEPSRPRTIRGRGPKRT